MSPILIHLGPLPIRAYGFMIVIGFLSAVWLAVRQGRRQGIDKNLIIDLCFTILVSALIGSKLLHLIVFWHDYVVDIPQLWRHPAQLLTYLGSGLIFFGGLLAAIPAAIYFLRKRSLKIWLMADILAPSIPLAHGFGRIGCFLAGCCYGKACHLPWGVTFSDPNSLAPVGIPLHPTQLYSSICNFSLVAVLLFLRPRYRKNGQLFWTYLLLYPIGRFIIEFFRDDERGFVLNGVLSTSQFISICIFLVALGAHLYLLLTDPTKQSHRQKKNS